MNRKKAIFAVLAIIGLTVTFWTGSRYPALDEKAAMAGSLPLANTLSFDEVIPLNQLDPTWKRIVIGTVNWIDTNKKGMTFGVLIGAVFLTFLGYIRRRKSKSRALNTLLGMAIGTPLGVCVNCAAPIARGLYRGGMSIESTLAAMICSPTLNVVVMTMVISLFPLPLVITKVILTLIIIWLVIPLIAKNHQYDLAHQEACALQVNELGVNADASWFKAAIEFLKDFWKSFRFIFKTTVPLMFVAGILGVALSEFLPIQDLPLSTPSFWLAIVAASIGVFLPAPIGLDVVLAQSLMFAGFPIIYVMIFLFTLGTFSIYSFFIVWTGISRKAAVALYLATAVLGVVGGWAVHGVQNLQDQDALDFLEEEFSGLMQGFDTTAHAASKPSQFGRRMLSQNKIDVYRRPYRPRQGDGKRQFTSINAHSIGLHRPIELSISEFFPPFFNGRGLAAGDFSGDGFDDLAIGTENGPKLFVNQGNGNFKPLKISNEVSGLNTFIVALVDLNNDGDLDLYFTTYGQGKNYILSNKGDGKFNGAPKTVPNIQTRLTKAAAFADYDLDGDLDIVQGNWFMGFPTPKPPKSAQNFIVRNSKDKMSLVELPGIPGESLSVLFSDFNMDNRMDLIVGNDFSRPDYFYIGVDKKVISDHLKKVNRYRTPLPPQ